MKNIILCLYFIFFIGISQCLESFEYLPLERVANQFVDTFEFVPITNYGEVTFSKVGTIGAAEKTVRIPIVIPPCSTLTYVRVDVDNKVGPPVVSMDFDIRTAVISYRPAQYSISSYVVTAKSVNNRNCG